MHSSRSLTPARLSHKLKTGPILPPKISGSLQLDCIRVNCDGSMVCALASLPGSGGCIQDARLFVYSAGRNGPMVLDLSQDLTAPRAVAWDMLDPRLLAVQTGALVRSQGGGSSSRPNSGDGTSTTAPGCGMHMPAATAAGRVSRDAGDACLARCSDVATVFATDEAGLLLQEYQDLDPASSGSIGFVGVCAPHLLLLKGSAGSIRRGSLAHALSSNTRGIVSSSNSGLLARVPLQCFVGLADADAATQRALLDFNYLLAVGRLDEAFRVVSALKSPAVWRNMAHMAIKNKQLAVAGAPARLFLCQLWRCPHQLNNQCADIYLPHAALVLLLLPLLSCRLQSTAWGTCSTFAVHVRCVRVLPPLSWMRGWGWWRFSWTSQTMQRACLGAVSAGTWWSSCRRRQAAGRKHCRRPRSTTGVWMLWPLRLLSAAACV